MQYVYKNLTSVRPVNREAVDSALYTRSTFKDKWVEAQPVLRLIKYYDILGVVCL